MITENTNLLKILVDCAAHKHLAAYPEIIDTIIEHVETATELYILTASEHRVLTAHFINSKHAIAWWNEYMHIPEVQIAKTWLCFIDEE